MDKPILRAMEGKSDRGKKGKRDERLVLPGRHAIEAPPRARGEQRTQRADEDLHVCPSCQSDLVHPVDWEPAGRSQWRVALRCPECEWFGEGVHSQNVVDRFDQVLDDGTESLLDDLTRLSRAIMEEEVERFSKALNEGLVLPEDF